MYSGVGESQLTWDKLHVVTTAGAAAATAATTLTYDVVNYIFSATTLLWWTPLQYQRSLIYYGDDILWCRWNSQKTKGKQKIMLIVITACYKFFVFFFILKLAPHQLRIASSRGLVQRLHVRTSSNRTSVCSDNQIPTQCICIIWKKQQPNYLHDDNGNKVYFLNVLHVL